MDYVSIKHLQIGSEYDQVFLIHDFSLIKYTQYNKFFAKITFTDVTGKINGVIWDCPSDFTLQTDSFIRAKILVNNFQSSKSFKIKFQNIQPYKGKPQNLHDYVITASDTVLDTYSKDLQTLLEDIDDADYRQFILGATKRVDIFNELKNAPYGQNGPFAYKGGLLVHTTKVIKLSINSLDLSNEMSDFPINKSAVILGGLFRNIGWTFTTFIKGSQIYPNNSYHLYGIYKSSFKYLDHLIISAENDLKITLPESKKHVLLNMCDERHNIKTLEGRLVEISNETIDILHFGSFDMKNFFTEHLDGI